MSVKPLSCLYVGSPVGTFTYLPSSLSARGAGRSSLALGAVLAWPQKPASALRKSSSPTRSSWNVLLLRGDRAGAAVRA